MSAGILIDAFIVRSLLAPAVLAVIGTASQWPGRFLFRRGDLRVRQREAQPVEEASM